MAKRARRRLPRWLKRTLIGVAALPILLPVLVLSALALPVTRRPIVRLALDYTNQSLDGMRIELDEATRLDLWGVELRGARLFDEKGRPWVSVSRAVVCISPFSLLRGTLRLCDVRVRGVRVHLYPSDQPEQEEPEEPDSEPSSFQIVAERLRVTDVSLDMMLKDRALHAVLSELSAAGAYGPSTRAALQKLRVSAELDGKPAASLASTYADWDQERGGRAVLSGDVLGASLRVEAEVPPIEDGTAWPVRRASVDLSGLTREGLARVGMQELVQLRVPVSLHAQAQTKGQDASELTANLRLRAGEEPIDISARATPSLYAARVTVPPVQLASLAGVLPELFVGADIYAELHHEARPWRAEASLHKLVFDGRSVPDAHLSALLDLPRIELKALQFAGLERALKLRGSYDTSRAAAELLLEAREFSLARLGGLLPSGTEGVVNGDLQAKLDAHSLSGHSDLSLRYFRMNDVHVASGKLALDLDGQLREPRGHVKLGAYQVDIGKNQLLRVELDANAGARDLASDLSVEGVDRFVSLALRGRRAPDGSVSLDAEGEGRWQDKEMGLRLVKLQLGSRGYAVQELTAFSGNERIYVSGSLDARDRIDVAVEIDHLDLEPWARLGLAYELEGKLDLRARAEGPLASPNLKAQLGLRGIHSARVPRAPRVDLSTELGLDMRKREATIALDTHSQDRRVELKLTAKAELDKRTRDLTQAFQRGHLALDLNGHTDIPFLAQFAEVQLGDLDGSVNLELSVNGSMDEAELDTKVVAQVVPSAERDKTPPDRITLEAALRPKTLDVSLALQDQWGKFVEASSNVKLPDGGVRGALAQGKALVHAPASLELKLNERRLDQLRGSLGLIARKYGAALPLRPAADIALESSGQAITGRVNARAHLWGDGLDENCGERAGGDVQLQAVLAGDKVSAQLRLKPEGGGEVKLDAYSALQVNDLLEGKTFAWGPAQVEAHGDALALHTMPTLCSLPPSRTRFQLSAKNLGGGAVLSSLVVDIDDVPTQEGPRMGLTLRANTSQSALSANGDLKLGGNVKGQFSATLPLAYADARVPTLPTNKPVRADLNLPDFPVSALAAFTNVIGRAGGRLGAELHLTGTLDAPQPRGKIELKSAAFSIASLAQPFSDVDGIIDVAPDKVIVRELKARDRDGKLSLKGYAQYNVMKGGAAELYFSADRFPVRQQGNIVGELTTRAKITGKVDAQSKLSLDLLIQGGRIWLTGKGGRQVQELDEHPDIRFDTERALVQSDQEEESAQTELSLALLRIHTENDLWLMHEDFSVQVGVDIKLTTDPEGVALEGQASITRGDLTLLGKPFRIEKGAVRFTGDVPPDPELDLKAQHKTRQGQEVNVQITGRASAPQITFSGAASNAGEAAVILSGIGNTNANSKAQNDAAAFASSLTAGLLAVSARRRFGDWVPMLALENDASGAPSGARAGFDASRLIPKFMRGFARSMYVEGVVGSRADNTSRGVGVGVRVEVSLPHDFMTSMGYGPGTVWSTDVYWSP